MASSGDDAAGVERELEAHRQALDDFIGTAEKVADEAWNAPRPGGKWSPAQVAEHLRLTYATVHAEVAGQGGFRLRSKWWQQRLFRFLYLPRILARGRFPKGVPAVREIRPGSGPFERRRLLDALREEGEALMEAIRSDGATRGATFTHPFLGKLGVGEGVRFTTQHIRHHRAQIRGGDAGPDS